MMINDSQFDVATDAKLHKERDTMTKQFSKYLNEQYGVETHDDYGDGLLDAVIPMGEDTIDRIVACYNGNMISLSVLFGSYPESDTELVWAMVDDYNASADAEYEVRCLSDGFWVEVDGMGVDADCAIAMIEKVKSYFTKGTPGGWWEFVARWMEQHKEV